MANSNTRKTFLSRLLSFFAFPFLLIQQTAIGLANVHFTNSAGCRQAYENILKLKLEEGKSLLQQESKSDPENLLGLLVWSYHDFIKAFITEEQRFADSLTVNTEKRLRIMEANPVSSPYLLYAKAEILMQNAFIKVKQKENISAALDIHKAYNLIEKNFVAYPTFPLNSKTRGMLNILIGSVPQNYQWLVRFVGLNGNIRTGLDQLNEVLGATQHGVYPEMETEILFLLSQVNFSISADEKETEQLLAQIKPKVPDEPLLAYSFINLSFKAGTAKEALAIMREVNYADRYPFVFLQYKTGLLKLRNLDLQAASEFHEFTRSFKGKNYIKSAYQKLAWIELLKGNQTGYFQILAQCKTRGDNLTDDDKEALNDAISLTLPDSNLLKARLLFDGGNYKEALLMISKLDASQFAASKDILEYHYRKGRIYHKLNLMQEAEKNYVRAYNDGKVMRFHYAANSALMLGLYYESQNEIDKAKQWLEKCLALKNHDFENSIDQKAQAALQRLKTKTKRNE